MQLASLQAHSVRPHVDDLHKAVPLAVAGDTNAQLKVCGAMNWAAFAAPAAITDVYDLIAAGERADPLPPSITLDWSAAPLTDGFWQAFETVLTGPEEGYDATSITVAVASLAGSLHEHFGKFAEQAANQHPGTTLVSMKEIPKMISLAEIGALPAGSLGRDLHSMLVDNGFDAEVLDREAIGLEQLSPALRYLNTRILQMHDIWHLVAGYQTTSLHEIAISAFQLAQFGHNYSAMFLATVASMSHLRQPQGFVLMLKNIVEAWQHGRQLPSFMDIEWEQEWHRSIESVRTKYGIEPFSGSFPPDLLEQLAAA